MFIYNVHYGIGCSYTYVLPGQTPVALTNCLCTVIYPEFVIQNGECPIHKAVSFGHVTCTHELIQHGALSDVENAVRMIITTITLENIHTICK